MPCSDLQWIFNQTLSYRFINPGVRTHFYFGYTTGTCTQRNSYHGCQKRLTISKVFANNNGGSFWFVSCGGISLSTIVNNHFNSLYNRNDIDSLTQPTENFDYDRSVAAHGQAGVSVDLVLMLITRIV